MTKTDDELKGEGQEILRGLAKEELVLLSRVIEAERAKIHLGSPTGIYDDIRKAIDEIIHK